MSAGSRGIDFSRGTRGPLVYDSDTTKDGMLYQNLNPFSSLVPLADLAVSEEHNNVIFQVRLDDGLIITMEGGVYLEIRSNQNYVSAILTFKSDKKNASSGDDPLITRLDMKHDGAYIPLVAPNFSVKSTRALDEAKRAFDAAFGLYKDQDAQPPLDAEQWTIGNETANKVEGRVLLWVIE